MDKIKIKMHRGNKHFVWGLSFVVFALIASVVWGLTYAEDTTVPPPSIPLPVTNLVGTVSGNSIVITWTNTSTNQDKFNISRRMNGGALLGIAMSPGPDTTSYTDTSVIAGNTYDYQVEACLSGTGCAYMTEVTGIVVPSTPGSGGSGGVTTNPPQDSSSNNTSCTALTLTLNDVKTSYTVGNNVNYTWTCTPGGTASNVTIRLQKPDGTMTTYNSGSGSSTQSMGFSTSNLVPGNYILKACFDPLCGTGTVMATQNFSIVTTTTDTTTVPSAPTNLTATVNGSSVTLNWTDNSNNEAGFKIYRGPTWTDIGNVGANVTTFTDSLRPVGTYMYRLNAFNSSYMYSPISNDVTVTVGGTAGGDTTTTTGTNSAGGGTTCTGLNLVLNDGKTIYKVGDMVNYTWNCVPTGSTGTVSMWLNKPDGTMVNYNTGTGSNTQSMGFSTSNLVPGQYILKACLGTNCTTAGTIITTQMFSVAAAGTIISTTPDNVKPTAPTNLTARVDGNKVTLNWTDNSNNEAGFKIYRGPTWTDIGNVGANVTTFTDSLRPAGTYMYRLNAFNSSYMYSPISNDVTVTVIGTTTTAPVPPTTTPVVAPTTTPKTTVALSTTTVNTTATNTPVETSGTTTGTTATTKLATTATPEVKEPVPVETPTQIINNVTDALNILSKPTETTTVTETTTGGTTETATNNGDIKVEQQPAPTPAQIAQEIKAKEEIVKLVYQDTNKDGISDYDSKYVYNMDPVKASPVSFYEGRNVNAGEKILLGFDPSKKELEKVVAEEPTTEAKPGIVVSSYKVNEVKLVDTIPTKETTSTKETTPVKETKITKAIALKGVALPNSFITIYIYSTPIMVTVKTDKNGEWNYTLDKELENGNHTVYTATVNNTGNIVAKSTPFTFVKTAEAVTLQDIAPIQVAQASTVEKPGFLQTNNIFIIVIAGLMMIGIILILIGLLSKKTTQ